ncbi:MAG: hypothetical protein R6V12_18755, partial [Candidatus Hydrogenedentota bacterium]
MKSLIRLSGLAIIATIVLPDTLIFAEDNAIVKPEMYFTDCWTGRCFAKDPDVARFKGKYFMYYTTRQQKGGIAVGIAESDDL